MKPAGRWILVAALSTALGPLALAAQEGGAQSGEPTAGAGVGETAQDPAASAAETEPAAVAAQEGAAAVAGEKAPGEPEELPLDRIEFEFKVPEESGGGTITGSAGAIETDGESGATLSGGVQIAYKRTRLKADRVVLHRDTMTLEAEGDVVYDEGLRRVGATRADYDLATETGSFWNATAYVEPDQYFWGKVVTKTGDDTFEVVEGVLTSCTGDVTPDWSLKVGKARVEVGGYAHVKHGTVRMKKMPLFYWPYMIWPAKNERSSGFLIPTIGYSETRGAALGLSYYQVMGPSADLTIQLDGFEKAYAGAGAELRYAPTEGTRGTLNYYLLADRDADRKEWRWSLSQRNSDLPFGMTGVVEINDYSDFNFFRQFERSERRNTLSYIYSDAFASGSWGQHSLSVIADQRESFLSDGRSSIQRQLPKANYRLRKLKLGTLPVYVSLDSTAAFFHSETTDTFSVDYGRFDASPEVTVPLRVAPWMSVAVTGAMRATWWGDSVPARVTDPETGTTKRMCGDEEVDDTVYYCGQSLSRTLPAAEVAVVGPSFSKIFDSPGGKFSKFKHVIEPRWGYNYLGTYDDQARVPRFDGIDGSGSATELAEVAIVNRVLAKPTDEKAGGAFEIFSFELAQAFSFRDDQPLQRSRDGLLTSQKSSIFARLRYSPSKAFDLQGRAQWSTLFSGLESTSLSGRYKGDRTRLDLTWYTSWDAEQAMKRSDQARLGGEFAIVPRKVWFGGQVNYDLLSSSILQQNYWISYESQCWSVLLEGREQTTTTYQAREYRFMLNLKNVGTFLDLNGGNATSRF